MFFLPAEPVFRSGAPFSTLRRQKIPWYHPSKTHRFHILEVQARFMEEAGSPLKIVDVTRNITARKTAELKIEEQNRKLADALAEKERLLKEIKVLEGLLPICSGCKRIRDDDGKWWPLDAYIQEYTDSEITHTICPDCKDVFFPDHGKSL